MKNGFNDFFEISAEKGGWLAQNLVFYRIFVGKSVNYRQKAENAVFCDISHNKHNLVQKAFKKVIIWVIMYHNKGF